MGKGSGSSRTVDKTHNRNQVALVGGTGDAEFGDISAYYLPQNVRDNLEYIESVKTYAGLERYLSKQGIELDTDRTKIKEEGRDKEIPAMRFAPQIVAAIETYKSLFGKDGISALKKIKLHDDTLDTTAAFHYNTIGENDPYAGTIRFSNRQIDGKTVFHEMAHVLQESYKRRGEDATTSAARLVGKQFKGDAVDKAEMFADAFANGFLYGKKSDLNFITTIRNRKK